MPTSRMYSADENRRDPSLEVDTLSSVSQDDERNRDDEWLQIAITSYNTSTDYFDSSIRNTIEGNISHFQNRHRPGSKYHTDSYKFRAKGFRPKTRSFVRKNEAAAAVALFSTSDVVHVEAEDDTDEVQRVSSIINQELLQYRLDNTIPWYETAIGAYQETLVNGVVISHQFWDYRETIDEEPVIDQQTGNPVFDELGNVAVNEKVTVISDTPATELRPIENIRFSPSANWADPLNDSPYLIDRFPMTVGDIKRKMQSGSKVNVPWFRAEDGVLLLGRTSDYDPIRQQRDKKRQDAHDQRHSITEFDTVWIHRNIVRRDGRDWIFYTVGVHHRLSDPIPLEQEYPHLKPGQRPYVMGFCNLEAHRTYPSSLVELGSNTQQEANDINNQRRDNVSLVLNRRYFVRRGAKIDYKSLTRNVPGAITLMDDINQDIRVEAPPEVTGSSYQEQDRVNLDFDELVGNFSSSSVGSNRQLNETVGGMELLSGGANQLVEFQLRTFVTTWVEPVLKQLIQLEQRHETDEAILAMVGRKVNMWERYGVSQLTDQMLQGTMTVEVNVGFGATNPQQRIEKLSLALTTVLNFAPHMAARLDAEEVATEVFGAAGFKGVDRFFPTEPDPNKPPPPEAQPDPRMQIEQMKAQMQMQLEQFRSEREMAKAKAEAELKMVEIEARIASDREDRESKRVLAQFALESDMLELATRKELSLEQIKAKLGEASMRERGQNERFVAERDYAITHGGGRGL